MSELIEFSVPYSTGPDKTFEENQERIVSDFWYRMEYLPKEISDLLRDNFTFLYVNVDKETITFSTPLLETKEEFLTILKMST